MNEIPDSSKLRPTRGQKRIGLMIGLTICALLILAAGAGYWYIGSGGLTARQKTWRIEAIAARALLDWSVPRKAKQLKSPLDRGAPSADLAAGRDLYQRHCDVCHGYDGGGNTSLSGGLYPTAASLRKQDIAKKTDGELFYFIRNGVRNTGMPGWQLPDRETWQLVAYIRALPETNSAPATEPSQPAKPAAAHADYAGSVSCQRCHSEIYSRWKKTPMANVVRDPREHPEAIIPDFSKPDPLVNFTPDDISLVYGSIWKQRYFKKVGDEYYVFPAQWDVTHKKWRPYAVKDDWWVAYYPKDNFERPTSALCDGCHSVNYDIATKKATEWNVGCEKCHGPGSEHVKAPASANILNAARLGYVAGNDICIQCHSQGRPPNNPISGKYYDWPVGYEPGRKLSDYWDMETHKLGETSFTHFADGTAHKNRMQGNDYVTSQMYTHGVACFSCHDVHGTENPAQLRKPASALCLDCHGPNSPNGPRAPTLAEHTHHQPESTGSECIACHMPKIAQTIADVNVRSHTFRFVGPAMTASEKIPNACNACHTDKAGAWAADALKAWAERSPWRD